MTGARSKNLVVHYVQAALTGENLVAKDSDSIGHKLLKQSTLNSSIVTF